jgi:hypothetical protein
VSKSRVGNAAILRASLTYSETNRIATEIARFEAINRSSSQVGSGTTIRPTTAITSAASAASADPTRGFRVTRRKAAGEAKVKLSSVS